MSRVIEEGLREQNEMDEALVTGHGLLAKSGGEVGSSLPKRVVILLVGSPGANLGSEAHSNGAVAAVGAAGGF